MCRHSRSNAQTTNVSWEVGKGECQADHHCISHCEFEEIEALHDAASPYRQWTEPKAVALPHRGLKLTS